MKNKQVRNEEFQVPKNKKKFFYQNNIIFCRIRETLYIMHISEFPLVSKIRIVEY